MKVNNTKQYCSKCGASKEDYKKDKISCGFGRVIDNHKWGKVSAKIVRE